MFEGLAGELRLDAKVAVGVARDLPGAHVVDLLFHAFAGMLGSGNEVYLILFDGPAGHVGGCVVGKLVSREGFDL